MENFQEWWIVVNIEKWVTFDIINEFDLFMTFNFWLVMICMIIAIIGPNTIGPDYYQEKHYSLSEFIVRCLRRSIVFVPIGIFLMMIPFVGFFGLIYIMFLIVAGTGFLALKLIGLILKKDLTGRFQG